MFRALVLVVAAATVGLVAVGLVGGRHSAEAQQTASATRSFSPSEVEAGRQLVVTIAVDGYGGIGQLRETFPADFTFESSPEGTGSGQTVTFNLVGDTSVSYTLTAPTTTETRSISGFSGTLEPAVTEGVGVSGPSSVTVLSPPAQETASATRSFSPSEVEAGGQLVVTIAVDGYGGIGQLTETFPADFTFESSPEGTRSGQTLTFNLVADASVSYTLTAPTTTETRSISGFSGTLEPAVTEGVGVSGPSSVTVLSPPAQETASATRSFSPSEVASGGQLVVTIAVDAYGGIGQLTETFPADFTFESSPEGTRSGQTLTFNLVADTSVSYTLTAPTTTETRSISGFSGTLEPAVTEGVGVSGPSSVTVLSPPAQETASATRSFSPSEVEAGGQLVVTIAVDAYGGIGQLTETFPADFTFESSPEGTRSGQTLTFNLVADTSVSYTLTAPTTTETRSISGFSGTLEPAVTEGVGVSGPSSVTVLSPPAQETASATRSFSPSEVEAGGPLTVTIAVDAYGGFGQLTETFPADFTFESSPEGTRSGQTLTFNLVGDTSVSYTLRAPTTTETRSISGFSGTLEPAVTEGVGVSGPSSVTVRRPSSGGGGTPANRAPVFSEGASATRSVAENSAAGTAVGRRVTATDPDGNRVTYSLGGDDASLFAIDPRTGQVSVGEGTALDFETKSSYAVTARAADRRNSSDTIALTITVTNVGLDDSYDANDDGMIDGTEVLNAVVDYFNDVSGIDSERILDIVELYFSS